MIKMECEVNQNKLNRYRKGATKMDKEKKKMLLQQYKENQKNAFLNSLPMSVEDFKKLFDFLDESEDDCENSFNQTLQFLNTIECDFDAVLRWLAENGGGCDCEVLYNIEEIFEEYNIL